MKKIAVLDKQTIDKIAAGEVVERPSSVVKELVENAIDAGASAVTVEITDGGKKLIRITDNGSGMDADQVPTAFLRHATSKIEKVEDLEHIASLGFRGEALSSIAAVAQVELITKTTSAMSGIRYVIEGGEEQSIEELGAPEGTTFLVRNLFYNTPARSKFLHSDTTEGNYISTLMEQLALSHPEVSFKYIQNKQVKLHTSGNGNVKDVIYHLYGRDIAKALLDVDVSNDFMKIEGFVGKPEISRGNRAFENYYINGRYVKNRIISKAIEDAYKGFLMQHKFPFVSLHIEMTGNDLDVNVHPSKMEVRFARGPEVYDAIFEAVRRALTRREMIPQVTVGKTEKQPSAPPVKRGMVPEPFENRRREQLRDHAAVNPVSGAKANSDSDVNTNLTSNTTVNSFSNATANSFSNATVNPDSNATSNLVCNAIANSSSHGTDNSNSIGMESSAFSSESQYPDAQGRGSAVTPGQTFAGRQASYIRETGNYGSSGLSREEESMFQGTLRQREAEDIAKANAEPKPEQLDLFQEELLAPESRIRHRLIGQLFDTYWLVQFGDMFYMIDQHAAHEKIYYERFVKQFREQSISSQYISPPLMVTLNLKEEQLLNANLSYFRDFGFEIENFGGKEYCISAVPTNLYGMTEEELFLEMLDHLAEEGEKDALQLFTTRLATMACKAAVKGNHQLSFQEADKLIDELLTLENPYHCPHGRPTIISMSKEEIEKKFHRIV